MVEDAVGWMLSADEDAVIAKLADLSVDPPTSIEDVVAHLKAKKMDIIAYELVAEAIATTILCRERASDLLGGLACACAGVDNTRRFVRDGNGLWIFQP